jgi:hypothetical protein
VALSLTIVSGRRRRRRSRCQRPGPGILECDRRPPPGCGSVGHRSAGRRRSPSSSAGQVPAALPSVAVFPSPLAPVPPAHRQSLLAVEPLHSLPIDGVSLAPQQHGQATVTRTAGALEPGLSAARATPRRPVVRPDSARLSGRSRSPGKPAVRSSQRSDADTSSPPVAQRASPLFSRRSFSAALSSMASASIRFSRPFLLQRPQPLGVRHLETAELGLPFIERRRACGTPPPSEPQPPAPAAPR